MCVGYLGGFVLIWGFWWSVFCRVGIYTESLSQFGVLEHDLDLFSDTICASEMGGPFGLSACFEERGQSFSLVWLSRRTACDGLSDPVCVGPVCSAEHHIWREK